MGLYKIQGNHQGIRIDNVVEAKSARQAKLKVAFGYGLGGQEIGFFMKDPKVKVRKK